MEELEDYELVELVKNDHEGAFDVLLRRYTALIMTVAKSYYGTYYDEKDFFQFGSMALLNAACSFDEDRAISFYTYALTCVKNEIIAKYRQAMRKVEYSLDTSNMALVMETSVPYTPFSPNRTSSNFELDETFSRKEIIKKALASKHILSIREHSCLERYLLGESYTEIGKRLGLNYKQVDNALSRCRVKLKALEDEM